MLLSEEFMRTCSKLTSLSQGCQNAGTRIPPPWENLGIPSGRQPRFFVILLPLAHDCWLAVLHSCFLFSNFTRFYFHLPRKARLQPFPSRFFSVFNYSNLSQASCFNRYNHSDAFVKIFVRRNFWGWEYFIIINARRSKLNLRQKGKNEEIIIKRSSSKTLEHPDIPTAKILRDLLQRAPLNTP